MSRLSRIAILSTSLIAPCLAQAAVFKCDAEEPDAMAGLEWVAYDTDTRSATIRYMGKTLKGRITLARPHKPYSDKLNMEFPSPFSFHDTSASMEVIVFPVSDTQHRLVGAVTLLIDGKRYMDFGVKNVLLRCRDLAL